jgi:mycothiol synthase
MHSSQLPQKETTMPLSPTVQLPPGYVVRPPAPADAAAIVALLKAFDLAETGEVMGFTEDDIRGGWEDLDMATDAWTATAPDGTLAGYAEITDFGYGQLMADAYTHPAHTGCGIGTLWVRLSEARARELVANAPEGARVVLVNNVVATSQPACSLLEREGYTLARYFWTMRITLDEAPAATEWPAGVSVRPCVPGQDERAIYETVEEAFADHWGHTPRDFEDWIKRTRREDFDPTLWFLAEQGGESAGVALCRSREESGWVNTLAVRRPWRRRGLGMALLRHAFGEFYRRGQPKVGLGVDSESLTGATRLYERAGMHVTERAARYEKELRPGADLSTQALAE